ncbi:Uncharacterised protein [Chryseobacterium nakagawai]|uniref:Uncharacterized protein n=1 Tax=Chryseobacterium nakagawai TaxID=1241982 RepID=A0AAD0YL57_CHRNA|nr:hypothetical protein [Chryseobacterium nakagawai]AZA90463.1 hypothetical protein EG343_07445 [Chryseobacterium nakagawai]VEH21962.1 Uncharacterised protein [Chryseobacterium nakagawai]
MNQNIADQYNLTFEDEVQDWGIHGKSINKIVNTNYQYLTTFLNSWNSAEQINASLLPDINDGLNNPHEEIDSDAATIDIIIHRNEVDFYDDVKGYVGSIPLQDFKEIIIEWRDFLKRTPSGGSKVRRIFNFF